MSSIGIESIKSALDAQIREVKNLKDLDDLRIRFLGRKGMLAELMSQIPALPQEERSNFGQEANALKSHIAAVIDARQKELKNKPVSLSQEAGGPDLSMPGIAQELGRLHPVTQTINEICTIFMRMGFSVVEGPEIETEYNNFTGLNIPLDHPSRDAFDTFYLQEAAGPRSRRAKNLLLRSHTSPVQIRAMKSQKPPLAVVVPGRVYRPDATDASHSFMFHQVEGFMVDTNITFADLKGTLELFVTSVFGKDLKMRFRPHFFPFTEPSAEVDISCVICKGKGCSSCGKKGWLEILGSGMIHPNVFKNVGYDPKKYTGFAFGMGVERIAMLKYGIKDIRMFYENDLRFLKQF